MKRGREVRLCEGESHLLWEGEIEGENLREHMKRRKQKGERAGTGSDMSS